MSDKAIKVLSCKTVQHKKSFDENLRMPILESAFQFSKAITRNVCCFWIWLWTWYQNCLADHPIKTQVISSGILWGVGDIAAQSISLSSAKKNLQVTHADKKFKIDWKRAAITGIFGFGFIGPVGHFWYEGMDRLMRHNLQLQPNSVKFVAAKVAIDSLIIGPFDLFMFFTYMGFCSGKNVVQVKEDLKRDFFPALILEGGIWPIVQIINFRYVPVRYQLLYVNFFCLLDSVFLSWMEQQKEAPWKKWLVSFPVHKG